jgi:ribose/xylose/arabinose/galactoside ABC-type transport system permease subunit
METAINGKQSPAIVMKRLFLNYGIIIALLVICAFFATTSPVFLTSGNLSNVLNQVAINSILAIGVTFVILTGGIDLGLGSYVALAGCFAAMLAQSGEGLILPVLVGILAGAAVGIINGALITKARIAPFIVTMGMMTVTRGIALVVSDGRPISDLSSSFNAIAGENLLGIQLPVIYVIVIFLAAMFLLNKTVLGRYIYAVGGNEEAARASGINTQRIKIFVYTLCGALAGIAGIMQASRITTGQPNIGSGYELDAIASAVIGGTSLSGGSGKIFGTIIGALIIGVINNGLDLLNVSSYYQQIVKGLIIIGALLLDQKRPK